MIQNQASGLEHRPPLAGPILCFGFLTAVLTWCVWYVTHFPGVSLPGWLVGTLVLLTMWVGMTGAGIAVGAGRAWKVGLGAGLVCAILDLLVLGSFLVETPAAHRPAPGFSGLRPQAYLYIPGFLLLGSVIGLAAATIAARIERTVRNQGTTVDERVAALERANPGHWLSRFAIVTVATIAPLLLSGGGVTSTQSGMAVPGWPDSYGANMFLYPISLMTGRVFFEHSHRLFGGLAGLTMLTLTIFAFAGPATRKARSWSLALFILVCIQGVIGGWGRVILDNPYFGALHGILAQLIFAGVVALAVFLSPLYHEGAPFAHDGKDRRRKALASGLLHATLLQLALGAMYRHLKATPNPGSMHILWTHAGFALIVVIVAMLAGFVLRARPAADPIGPSMRRLGTGILVCVAAQFILGWMAFGVVLSGEPIPPPTAGDISAGQAPPIDVRQAVVTTLHQANGALLLALATLGAVWTRRIWQDSRPSLAR